MKTYKFLALVALVSLFMVNVVSADNVTLTRGETEVTTASDVSAFNEQLQDGDVIKVNNSYSVGSGDNNYLELNRKSISITADNPVTITGNGSTLFLYSNTISSAKDITFDLNNIEFTNGSAGNGGFARFDVDRFAISATNVTLSNNSADVQGGAFYFSNSVVFKGYDSSITFTGNQVGSNENKTPNDIFSSGSVTFTETGVYNLNGGVTANGSLSLTEGVNIAFKDAAVNKVENLTISGSETKATFAQGTTTTVNGSTTIQNTGTTTVDDKTVDNIEFEGNQTFNTVVVSNGGNVTFGGTNTSTGTVTVKDTATKAHFDGAQLLSQIQITNRAKAESSKKNTFSGTQITVDNYGEFDVYDAFKSAENELSTLNVGNKGVVNLLWADDTDIVGSDIPVGDNSDSGVKEFLFIGNLNVNNGGTVNLPDDNSKLVVNGYVNGQANGALNLAIVKTALNADTNLYGVEGNTLTVTALGNGANRGTDYIDVLANEFNYHDETQMFKLVTLTNGQLTLGEFLQAVQLPFSWFGSLSPDDYTFINQDMNGATNDTLYIFKVDGDKVPEPSTWALLVLGVAGLYLVRRKNLAK